VGWGGGGLGVSGGGREDRGPGVLFRRRPSGFVRPMLVFCSSKIWMEYGGDLVRGEGVRARGIGPFQM